MDVDLSALSPSASYKILTALVIPRPIAWVTTVNDDGTVNAAPYSFFNVMGNRPPLVAIGAGDRSDGTLKDTPRNIAARGVFVVNLVHDRVAEAMHKSAAPFPPGVSETEALGLATQPSKTMSVPRIAACKVHLECRLADTITVGENRVILGLVQHIHVQDGLIDPVTFHISAKAFTGVGRLQGPGWYCTTHERFDLGALPAPTFPPPTKP